MTKGLKTERLKTEGFKTERFKTNGLKTEGFKVNRDNRDNFLGQNMWSRNCLYCLYLFAALQLLSLFFAALQLKSLFKSFLKQALEQFLQLVFRHGTHLLLYRLTVLEEQQCGHRHHAIGSG